MLEPNVDDWSEAVDDGGKMARDSGEESDVELSSSESSDESDGLVTVSERHSGSDLDVPRISVLYSAAAKNLPVEETSEEVTFQPSYLSEFEKEHFHRENMMPDRLYTAFFNAPSSSFTTKDIFDALLTDGIPASAVRCLQRSPNGNVFITFALQKYRDLFLHRSSFTVRWSRCYSYRLASPPIRHGLRCLFLPQWSFLLGPLRPMIHVLLHKLISPIL